MSDIRNKDSMKEIMEEYVTKNVSCNIEREMEKGPSVFLPKEENLYSYSKLKNLYEEEQEPKTDEIDEVKKFFFIQEKTKLDEKYEAAMDFVSMGDIENNFSAGIVFEELFVNIYNYAYEKQGNGPVMAEIKIIGSTIEITFIDFGIPFNPVERANWMSSAKQIGGRGIDIVKSYSKTFEYHRINGANIVRVVV